MPQPLPLRQIEYFADQNYVQQIILRPNELEKSDAERRNYQLTRSLAALVLESVYSASEESLYKRIVDGFDDNGIDGIFYNSQEKNLSIIQTKWISNGNSGLQLGDIHKFLQGVKDIVNAKFECFNAETKLLQSEINTALMDPNTRITLCIVATTTQPIPDESKKILDEYMEEQNSVEEQFFLEYYDLKKLHNLIKKSSQEGFVEADILLSNWYEIRSPEKAIGGQISGEDLSNLLDINGPSLFSPNIRYFLGRTEVNDSIYESLKTEPDKFWYFNNGVTAISSNIAKVPLGGSSKATGLFKCSGYSIVNGAQTVGTLHRAKNEGNPIGDVIVNLRIIEVKEENQSFGVSVTRKNNTQNRIDSRDFISLDTNQKRIYDELLIEGIVYAFKSGDVVPDGLDGFGFEEAAISRACFFDDVGLMVQAKREISKLWSDVTTTPYTRLFNSSVEGPKLWNLVKIFRHVERWIHDRKREETGRNRLMVVHSNRFLLMLVFKSLKGEYNLEMDQIDENIIFTNCASSFSLLNQTVEDRYPHAVLGSLFKNKSKCEDIYQNILA